MDRRRLGLFGILLAATLVLLAPKAAAERDAIITINGQSLYFKTFGALVSVRELRAMEGGLVAHTETHGRGLNVHGQELLRESQTAAPVVGPGR